MGSARAPHAAFRILGKAIHDILPFHSRPFLSSPADLPGGAAATETPKH
jgi:hypothetical protein